MSVNSQHSQQMDNSSESGIFAFTELQHPTWSMGCVLSMPLCFQACLAREQGRGR